MAKSKIPTTVLLFSGGVDSTYLYYDLLTTYNRRVIPLTFLQADGHGVINRNGAYDANVAAAAHQWLLDKAPFRTWPKLVSPIIATYNVVTDRKSGLNIGRHLLFLSEAIKVALANGADEIAFGTYNKTDPSFPPPPDASQYFMINLQRTIQAGGLDISVRTLGNYSKFHIIQEMLELVSLGDFLQATRWCYNRSEKPFKGPVHAWGARGCGKCTSCIAMQRILVGINKK